MSRALGRYELLRPLARGGMAEVYLARRRAAGVEKWLVVKRMRPERAGDARFLDLFVREARLSMSLAHQNIVPVFDFGRIDDQVFIAMERVEGKDLGSSLARAGKKMPALLAAFVAAECCQALEYAHRRKGPDGKELGIVHRDVTPRNVLLSWSGEVKLTDFGIAALRGDNAAKAIGTPAYMAPEQARGEELDARADLYAVGLVLREAVTGMRARGGDDREGTVVLARAGELKPWPDVEVDERVKEICEKACAADPAARFADAKEMLEALDAFIVTERAGKKVDAPARQLAAWLADVWKDEPAESGEIDAAGGEHLVSYLDDGLDVVGTGTVRSMALTAAEAEEPVKPEPKAAPAPKRKPRVWWVPAVVGAIAIGVVVMFVTEKKWTVDGEVANTARAAVDVDEHGNPVTASGSGSGSGSATAAATATAAVTATATGSATATAAATGSGTRAPLPDPVSRKPNPDPVSRKPHPPAIAIQKQTPALQHALLAPQPAPTLYKVKINIAPWAFFTVDDDTTKHQTPDELQLSAGPHRVHFWNDQLHAQKDLTVDVPAHSYSWAAGKIAD